MKTAKPMEVGSTTMTYHSLIATQDSGFKDSLTAGIVEELKDRDFYIKVIDTSALHHVEYDNWTVLILLHTWEYRDPPKEILKFMDRVTTDERLIHVTTSNDGIRKMENVDAITSASKNSGITENNKRNHQPN